MNLEVVDGDIFKVKPSTQVLTWRNWKPCQDIQTMRFGHSWLRKITDSYEYMLCVYAKVAVL